MIIHELGTNSAKYGSLSAADGSVEITRAIERCKENDVVLDWIERGGVRRSLSRRRMDSA
jgi:two-component sensor histidine kinase